MNSETHEYRMTDDRAMCRSIMDAVTDAILIFDPQNFHVIDANTEATELYGYSRGELLGKQLSNLTNEYPAQLDPQHLPVGAEAIHVTSRGEPIHLLVSFSQIEFCGRPAILSINRDIAELKRIQASLASSEKKFRFLIQNVSEIVALIDIQGIVKFISPQAERILGVIPSEIVEHNIFSLLHPEERERAREEYSRTIREPGENVPSVLRFRDFRGEWIPFEIIANNQLEEPDVNGVIFTARDLRYRRELEDGIRRANAELDRRVETRTMQLARANAALRLENQQRRATEKQLQESVSVLNATLESTADGILVISTDGTIRSFNQKFVEMWHIPDSALVTLSDETLLRCASPQLENPEEFLKSTRDLYASPDESSLRNLRLKDGRIFERYSQPLRVASKVTGRVWSFRDVTQEQRLQEELRQAQKMEAVGRLAGGVAHDFNNVLMLISGYAEQLLGEKLTENGRSLCEQLVAATSRAVSVTRQLLAFSRKNPVAPTVFDLNEVISDLKKMLTRLLSDEVELNIALQSAAPLFVYADRAQIELMIVNLVLNARDAMPAGGTLSIATRREALDNDKATVIDAPQKYVVLQISDTGQGMTADVRSRIFEPFFTTKDVGKGTGLGLSTAYGIVEQAGGHITVESEPNQGATFRVYFPAAQSKVVSTMPDIPSTELQGRETILLVEDEEGIRIMTRTYLENLGYKVLDAGAGSDALRISREYSSAIDLLLSDVLMPGMRGDELARLIGEERPGIRTIFISGYANVHELNIQASVLEKPFAFPELGKKIRETLDSGNQYLQQRRAS